MRTINDKEVKIILPSDLPPSHEAVEVQRNLVLAMNSFEKAKLWSHKKHMHEDAERIIDAYEWLAKRNYVKSRSK